MALPALPKIDDRLVIDVLVAISLVWGLLNCFMGYRILKIVLGIIGFVLGGVLGAALGGMSGGGQGPEMVLGGLLGAVIGAVLLVVLWFVGIFLLGALVAASLAAVGLTVAGHQPEPVVLLVAAVAGGVVALVFQKLITILCTSFGGAQNVVLAVCHFARLYDANNLLQDPEGLVRVIKAQPVIVLAWLLLGVVGVVVQYTWTGKKPPQAQPQDGAQSGTIVNVIVPPS